ncbi:M24 family metallopeptidase [Candidatus Woesearchaeota archaeon]|nr:M24 family metallopeptidase [Candidatus Woesearchaeota archaeon]
MKKTEKRLKKKVKFDYRKLNKKSLIKKIKFNLNRKSSYSAKKLNSIKKACIYTDQLYKVVLKNFHKFQTENEVKKFMESWMRKKKLRKAFPIIVASCKNAFEIHHKPSNDKLANGFCYLDFGVRVKGYCSDMTRTFFIGKPSIEEKKLYKLVYDSQMLGIKNIKIGRKYMEIDLASRDFLGRYKKYFIHSLGHGLGKWIHMRPRASPMSGDIVMANDIVTVEPGIYIKGKLGIRIEDDIYIDSKGKVEVMCKSNKRLVCLPKR